MHKLSVDRRAATQFGVVSRSQAIDVGMSRRAIDRRLESGIWIKVYPSVYRVAASPRSWPQIIYGAWLWAGDDAVVSHRAALMLMGLELAETPAPELTIPGSKRSRYGVIVHSGTLAPGEVTRKNGLPLTSPVRTLLDLGAVLPLETVEETFEEMLRRRLVSVQKLQQKLSSLGTKGRKGAAVIQEILRLRGDSPATESLLETRVLRLLHSYRLPAPVRQLAVQDASGFIGRVDLAYPEVRLAVECDGYRWHSGRRAWSGDRERRNRLTAAGWTVIHVTWEDLRGPSRVIEQLRSLYQGEVC